MRQPRDVRELKELLRSRGSSARVIAKIEKHEALDHLDEIIAEADGIMVARGDLGVEIDVARMPVVQKQNRRHLPASIRSPSSSPRKCSTACSTRAARRGPK